MRNIISDISYATEQLQEILSRPSAFHVHDRVQRSLDALERIYENVKNLAVTVEEMEAKLAGNGEALATEQLQLAAEIERQQNELNTP